MNVPKHKLVHPTSGQNLLEYQADRLAPHFAQVLLLTGESTDARLPGRVVADPPGYKGEGPLAGLLAALRVATTPWIALLAVDQPGVTVGHYELGLQAAQQADQAVLWSDSDDRVQWLCGLYRASVRTELERQMAEGVRAAKRFGNSLNLRVLPATQKGVFINLNTPEEAAQHGWRLPSL
jgi:molybdopterin-guanine dinucleotide biosynthesis protein A